MTRTIDETDHRWSFQDAEARFGEVVRRAESQGPQHVIVDDHDTVVVMSAAEFRRLTGTQTGADLIAAMQRCPYPDFEFEFPSVTGPVRDVDL